MNIDNRFWDTRFPMVRIFDFDAEQAIVYESKANFIFLISKTDLALLESYLKNPEDGCVPDGMKKIFGDMRACGLFREGAWEKMFDTSEKNLDELIKYNAESIFMRKFVLEITQDCNFRCSYCSNTLEKTFRHHQKMHMPLSVAKASADMYFRLYTDFLGKVPEQYRKAFVSHFPPTLGFYGGEPTLNWKVLTQAADYYKSLPWEEHGVDRSKLSLTVNSNLSHISEEMLRFLVDNDAQLFASLDGPASEHDKCRVDVAGQPTFERAYRNLLKIKNFDKEYFEHKVLILAVEADEYDRKLTHEFLDSLGCQVNYLSMTRYDCFVNMPEERIKYIETHRGELIEAEYSNYMNNPEKSIADYTFATSLRTDRPSYENTANLLPTCPVGKDNIMVDVEGNLHICHKTDGSFVLGNVESGLHDEALRSFYLKLAQLSNGSDCRRCWAFRKCGFCSATKLKGGSFVNPTEPECEYIRKSAEISFESLIRIYRSNPDFLNQLKAYVDDPGSYKGIVDINKMEWEKL